MNNYVAYIDTDSVFIQINDFLMHQGIDMSKWNSLDNKVKIPLILKLSKSIESIVNDRSYHDIQLRDYGSIVKEDDFSIKLKQEIVCPNALFLSAKMYAFWVLNNEGYDCDTIDAKGIEIVRSSSPPVFRKALKDVLKRLLKGDDDSVLSDIVDKYKETFYNAEPEKISVSIGANNLDKYIDIDGNPIKGAPYQVKGVAHYHSLLKTFDISYKYERIKEGDKVKIVYIKKNPWGFSNISYYKWPQEFTEKGIRIDYDLMIEKYFINKAKILLDPINKSDILVDKSIEDMFF